MLITSNRNFTDEGNKYHINGDKKDGYYICKLVDDRYKVCEDMFCEVHRFKTIKEAKRWFMWNKDFLQE